MEKENLSLSEEARNAQREYKRQWRAANPDKVKESNRRYWERRAQMLKETEAIKNADADN